jgi:bifunctional non-homologous end joining protein LigD
LDQSLSANPASGHTLRAHSFLLDGEAVNCTDNGLPDFYTLRYRKNEGTVFLYAFDLIELDGNDLRREPIERRKAALAKLLRNADYGIFLSEHIEEEAALVFQHACKLGLEGIVSKRRGSPYVSGRSSHWLKMKNPNSAAVRRDGRRMALSCKPAIERCSAITLLEKLIFPRPFRRHSGDS